MYSEPHRAEARCPSNSRPIAISLSGSGAAKARGSRRQGGIAVGGDQSALASRAFHCAGPPARVRHRWPLRPAAPCRRGPPERLARS